MITAKQDGELRPMGDGLPEEIAEPSGSVLVVDDEPIAREFAVESLRNAGFDAHEAADADDALRLLERRGGFKVLVTDVRMPGATNGYALARRVRERWPFMEIILVSGYAAPQRGDLGFDCDLLIKPFDSDELVRRVMSRAHRVTS
jgi:CheY-like chemotaxis protein